MNILIIQKKFMGDVLVTSAIFPLLKTKFPDSEISVLLDEKHAQILGENPYITNYIFFQKSFFKTLAELRKVKFDLVIDPYSKLETAVLSFLSGAKSKIGFYKAYTQFFYNRPVKRSKTLKSESTTFAIEHRLQLLEPLNISFKEVFPKVFLSKHEIENAQKILLKNNVTADDTLVMLSTFGSTQEKTYPLEFMAKVINQIAGCSSDVKILCNYMPFQKHLFDQMFQSFPEETKNRIVKNFETKNLREFIAVTSMCKCLIGNEGGATNVSKSLGVPTFTIFSPQIQAEQWAWSSDLKIDVFVHVKDYVPESVTYLDFQPTFFQDKLQNFLSKTVMCN